MSVEMLITLHVFFAVVVTFNPMAQEMEEYLKIPNGKLTRKYFLTIFLLPAIVNYFMC